MTDPNETATCPFCNGSGRERVIDQTKPGGSWEEHECGPCAGFGTIAKEWADRITIRHVPIVWWTTATVTEGTDR